MKPGFDLAGDAYEDLSFIFVDAMGTADGAVGAFNQLIEQEELLIL